MGAEAGRTERKPGEPSKERRGALTREGEGRVNGELLGGQCLQGGLLWGERGPADLERNDGEPQLQEGLGGRG